MQTSSLAARRAALALIAFAVLGHALQAQTNAASPLGKTNFTALYQDVPFPPGTTAEAARRTYGADYLTPDLFALEKFYQPFTDRVERTAEEYRQYYANRSQAYMSTQNEATMRAQYAVQINQNPIIASMGGVDAVQNMTPEQAEAAARKAAAEYMADPYAANNVPSAGMTALYQKIAADPEYAARFQKMSEKERESELRRYMANDKVQAKTPAQMQQDQQRIGQQMQDADKVRAAMMFQQYNADLMAKIEAARTQYENQRAQILAGSGNHDEIEADFQKKYDAIPEVIMGEGREKEPVQTQKLYEATTLKHREFAAKVLKQEAVLLTELQSAFNKIAAEHLAFLKAHRHEVNGNMADHISGTETETMLATLEMGLVGLADDLSKNAQKSTREAAVWEKLWWERIGRNSK